MFDENQLVKIKWSNKTRKHYELLGYNFTEYGEEFYVKAKDLPFGCNAKVVVTCDYCGKESYVSYCNYLKRANKDIDSCNTCKTKKTREIRMRKKANEKFDKLIDICKENNYILLTEKNEYTGVHMHVYYICAKHGLQHQSIDNMLHGHKCIRCSYEERGLNCRHSSEYIKSVIDSKNNNVLLNPEDYTGVFDKNLKIKCGECGNVYITNFDSYVSKNQIRCKHCSQSESNGEFIIRKFLEDNDVKFEQEKIFNDCKDNSYLPFDFYLPEYNLIIEFDGQHHFHKNVFDNFESTKIHDEIKNNYCSDNGIDILRIPYWEGNNIGNILKDKLCL